MSIQVLILLYNGETMPPGDRVQNLTVMLKDEAGAIL